MTDTTCTTCGTTITEHDTAPCDISECPIPMPAFKRTLPAAMVEVSTEPPAEKKPHHVNPIRTAHMRAMVKLGAMLTEQHALPSYPVAMVEPDDHRAVKSYLDALAMIFGDLLQEVGCEVNRNAVVNIDMKDFAATTFRDALDGFAFFEIERAAEAASDELEDARGGKGSNDFADELWDGLRRANKVLYGV